MKQISEKIKVKKKLLFFNQKTIFETKNPLLVKKLEANIKIRKILKLTT